MAAPTREQIEHYVRMFDRMRDLPWSIGETMCGTVVRRSTVDDVVSRLRGGPVATCRPAERGYADDIAFVEQRDDAVVNLTHRPGPGDRDGHGRGADRPTPGRGLVPPAPALHHRRPLEMSPGGRLWS